MISRDPQLESISGYKHISKVVGDAAVMMDRVRNGELAPYFTKSAKETEKIGGYYPSDQIVIAARTGCGKSTKALIEVADFCDETINKHYTDKLIILYDSYEMADWRNVLRMISREAGVETKMLLDYQKRLTEERYESLKIIGTKFKNLPIYITSSPLTVEQWKESKKQIQGRYPGHYIINLFDHTRLCAKKDEQKEEEKLTNLMVAGIDLKNNFNQTNIFISQMNRNIETAMSRDKLGTYLPVSSDIFGGDSVFQCADIVKALHRPGMYGVSNYEGIPTGIDLANPDKSDDLLLEVILKQREGWTGVITLKHNLALNHVEDYPSFNTAAFNGNSVLSMAEPDF